MPTPSDRIHHSLTTAKLPDFHFLASAAALQAMPKVLDALLAEAHADLRRLTRNPPEDATFASVVLPLLDIGRTLGRLWFFLENLHQASTSDLSRSLIARYQPKVIAVSSELVLSEPLYALLAEVQLGEAHLDEEQQRSLHLLLRHMETAGIHLPAHAKRRLKAIHRTIEFLSDKFQRNLVDDRKRFSFLITDGALVADMTEQERASARAEAQAQKKPGWLFTLSPPSYAAIMRACPDRRIREMFYRANMAVATRGKHDNRPLTLKILKLRREQAELLGLKTYAEVILQERMAKDVKDIETLVLPYARVCKKVATREVAHLTRAAGRRLQPWDVSFEAEKWRKEAWNFDSREVKDFFPLEQAIHGMFETSRRLYGVEARQLRVRSYAPDVRTYEIRRAGKPIGYLLMDIFARPNKRVGAWSTCLREPEGTGKDRVLPVLANVFSFGKATGRTPTLLSHADVTILFHEFGHALHLLLAETAYRNLHGYQTEWDFVELPSQLMENWCWEREALGHFGRHWKTRKPLPPRLFRGLMRSRTFLTGIVHLGQSELTLLDLLLHTEPVPRSVAELDRFCLRHARQWGVLPVLPSVKRHAGFYHVFGGGYAVGYYSYLWSSVLEADAYRTLTKRRVFDRAAGEKFRRTVLSFGALRPGRDMIRSFLGRDPDLQALMKKHGLVSGRAR